jgi:heme A synthase
LNKQVLDDEDLHFQGVGGFAIHGMNGMMIIPLIAIVFLIVSLLANKQLPGAAKRGGILFGMVALQVFLGLTLHDVVVLAPLHALNGLGILAMAFVTARQASVAEPAVPAVA